MKIVCISDTHSYHHNLLDLPDGDVLVHAGDVSSRGHASEVEDFLIWFNGLPHPNKIFIAGNHDFLFEENPRAAQQLLDKFPDIIYLENSEAVIEGVKFYGSPATPWFYDWAFNYQRGDELRGIWEKIPEDTNVLITHGPVYGVLDRVQRDKSKVGCKDLLERIKKLKKLSLFVCGHIHESYGTTLLKGVNYVNASICNLQYKPIHKPVVVEV
ncbi:metallophosphatase domain-containing protein [Cytophagaceae bacterium ABcell3]|nr:metallophosphatase domain-containing protein [Cytophagaceae bacterium ABcell3]